MALWWRCCWECGEFGFICQHAQMQWVPNNGNVCNPHSSILWYIPWQDWTRFSTYVSQLNSQCTQSDCSAHPKANINWRVVPKPNKRSHLLEPKPPQQCINRSDRITGRKYQKLYRYSNLIFSRTRAISSVRALNRRGSQYSTFGKHRWFETAVHPNSIIRPHHRSIETSERSFKPPIVAYLPFI